MASTDGCQGCGEAFPTKLYRAVFVGSGGEPTDPEEVRYCEHCAGLASVNWNGETLSIEPLEGATT